MFDTIADYIRQRRTRLIIRIFTFKNKLRAYTLRRHVCTTNEVQKRKFIYVFLSTTQQLYYIRIARYARTQFSFFCSF